MAMTNKLLSDEELRKAIYKTVCDYIHGDGACEQHEEVGGWPTIMVYLIGEASNGKDDKHQSAD